jgi:DNA-binding transcriptional LysR family regulator
MAADLNDLSAFMTVAQAGGFRDAARLGGVSASSLSEAVRRLEARLGVRLLNRTTRSIAPTEAGARLLERLRPALGEIGAAIDVVNAFRDRPAGTLRLNVPAAAARLVLPSIVASFLKAYPDIRLEVIVEDGFVVVSFNLGTLNVRDIRRSAFLIHRKIERILESGADAVVACDAGCLLHIEGGLRRHAANVKLLHLAEALARSEERAEP